MAVSREHLSQSPQGDPIQILASASPGTLIHTAAGKDDVTVWGSNVTAAEITAVIEWGGQDAAHRMYVTVPPQDTVLLIPGWTLASGESAWIYAGAGSELNVVGHVNRIS